MRDWPTMPLGEVADVRMGRQRSPKNAAGDNVVPYLRAANVKDGALDLSDVKAMNFDLREQDIFALKPGDVLVTEGCGSLEQLGASARWDGDLSGVVCFQNTLLRLRAREGVTLPGYVYTLARWLFWTGQWAEVSSGTNIFHIGSRRAATLMVPVPPIDVQHRVADLAHHADRYIRATEKVHASLARARSAVFEDELAKLDVDTAQLGDLAEIKRGGSPRPIDDYFTDDEDGLNWIKIGDVAPGGKYITSTAQRIRREGLPKTRHVESGTFLLSNSMSFGRPYITQIDGCIHDGWLALSDYEANLDAEFLYYLLRSEAVQSQFNALAAGSGVRNLNIKVVSTVEIPLPSLAEQKRIAGLANIIEERQTAGERTLEVATRFRRTVLSELFAGQRRVPDAYDRFLLTADGEVA